MGVSGKKEIELVKNVVLARLSVRWFVCRFRHRRCRFSHICVRLFKSSCDFCQSINLSPQKNAAAAATDWATRGGRRNIFHDRTLTEPSRFALLSYIVLAYFDFMDMSMDQTVSECVVFFINVSFEHTIFWVKLSPRTALHGALGGKFFILSSLSSTHPLLLRIPCRVRSRRGERRRLPPPLCADFPLPWRPLRLISKHEFYHFTLFSFAFGQLQRRREGGDRH